MITKHIFNQQKKIYAIIAGIGLVFCGIYVVQAAQEGKIYDVLYSNKNIHISESREQEITHIKNTVQANEAFKNLDYETALPLISGSTSEDYYNRGTIQTLLAYKNGLQNNISGREQAQIFIAQAQNSFDMAQKLGPSKTIKNTINRNKTTTTSLATVIDIKTCYGIGQEIITSINTTYNIIQDVKKILHEEDEQLNTRGKNIDDECYAKLLYIIDDSKEQVAMLQREIEQNKEIYLTDLSEKIDDPVVCLQFPYENILPSLTKGNMGLDQYKQGHQNTVNALKENTKESIYKLCNETKNDAEIYQDIESSVQEMLEKLDSNKEKKEENKATKKSQNIQHKDFLQKNEKEAIKTIQESNQSRIQNTLNIRGRGNYEVKRYLDTMFNQFYGSSGDFVDLHK